MKKYILILSILLIVGVGCRDRHTAHEDIPQYQYRIDMPANIEQIKFAAKLEGITEERGRWIKWRGERVQNCGNIINSFTNPITRTNDCCRKFQLLGQEFQQIFTEWQSTPELPIPKQ